MTSISRIKTEIKNLVTFKPISNNSFKTTFLQPIYTLEFQERKNDLPFSRKSSKSRRTRMSPSIFTLSWEMHISICSSRPFAQLETHNHDKRNRSGPKRNAHQNYRGNERNFY